MANFWDVIFNALWILGLAIILAVWSYARYTAKVHSLRLRDKLNTLKYALTLNIGLFLFLCGMALTENRWFVQILWILLCVGVLVESGMRIKQDRMESKEQNGQD